MASTVHKTVHKTIETANYDKVTATIRGSCIRHADEHTEVFKNKIEELGLHIQKSKAIIKSKL